MTEPEAQTVPVTPALQRRFVPRNFALAYAGHTFYVLGGAGGATLYAYMGGETVLMAENTDEGMTALLAAAGEAWEAANPRLVGKCRWFATCENPAVGLVDHPAFPEGVPTCQRCADRFGLAVH